MHSHPELLAVIRTAMREEREEDDMDGNYAPPGPHNNYQFHSLNDYISTHPLDELLPHELSGSECWAWQSIDYWMQVGLKSGKIGKGKTREGKGKTSGNATGSASKRRYGK